MASCHPATLPGDQYATLPSDLCAGLPFYRRVEGWQTGQRGEICRAARVGRVRQGGRSIHQCLSDQAATLKRVVYKYKK